MSERPFGIGAGQVEELGSGEVAGVRPGSVGVSNDLDAGRPRADDEASDALDPLKVRHAMGWRAVAPGRGGAGCEAWDKSWSPRRRR